LAVRNLESILMELGGSLANLVRTVIHVVSLDDGSKMGHAWTPAYTSDHQVREGAWVAELTGLLDLTAWPAGMRVIARKERPHPGAQLRLTTCAWPRCSVCARGS
jgi:hypothetical protein